MNINRFNIHKLFLAISLGLFLVGFCGLFGPKVIGLGKGFGAVFFCLFMIFNYLRHEKLDEELAEEQKSLRKEEHGRSRVGRLEPAKA